MSGGAPATPLRSCGAPAVATTGSVPKQCGADAPILPRRRSLSNQYDFQGPPKPGAPVCGLHLAAEGARIGCQALSFPSRFGVD